MQAPRLLEVRCRALRGIRRLAHVGGLPDAAWAARTQLVEHERAAQGAAGAVASCNVPRAECAVCLQVVGLVEELCSQASLHHFSWRVNQQPALRMMWPAHHIGNEFAALMEQVGGQGVSFGRPWFERFRRPWFERVVGRPSKGSSC